MHTSKRGRVFLLFIGFAILYSSVAVIFKHPFHRMGFPELPLPKPAQDAFLIFGVFSYYETKNQELLLWGFTSNAQTKQGSWKQLETEDYFPFFRGQQLCRMWASRQYRLLDKPKHQEITRFMGERIRNRHNERHPEETISKVAFELVIWPRSEEGFHARRTITESTRQWWIIFE